MVPAITTAMKENAKEPDAIRGLKQATLVQIGAVYCSLLKKHSEVHKQLQHTGYQAELE